jgi:nucleoside-diphosphate-sugar epimerase
MGPKAASTLGVIQLLYKLQAEEIGFVPYVGDGSAIFETLHVADFPPFVLNVLAEALETSEPKSSVYSRFYIITSQANTYKDISTAFAKLLHAQGIVDSPVPRSVNIENAGSGEMPNLQASNMLLRHDRATRLGWKPVKEGILEFLQAKLDDLKAGKD